MMLRLVALGALALAIVGCGSAETARGPTPTTTRQYLAYDRQTGKRGIWLAEADGSRPRFLVAGEGPVISPDGNWVAYSGPCDLALSCSDKLYVVSTTAGAEPRLLAESSGWPMAWLPDSKALVSERAAADGRDELLRIDLATRDEVSIARGSFRGWSISPDGKSVVFALAHGQAPENDVFPVVDLYVTPVDGRGAAKPVTSTGDSAYPVWGPKSIAFAKLIPVKQPSPETEFARNEIWRIQPDGTGRTAISGPVPERLLHHWHCIGLKPIEWSGDGTALLASVDCEALGEAVALDTRTGAIRSLGAGSLTVGLSKDARYALVQWGDERVGRLSERVLIYPYAGGKPTVVAKAAAAPSWNR